MTMWASRSARMHFDFLVNIVPIVMLYMTIVRCQTKDSVILASVVDTIWWLPLIIVLLIVQFINVHID